MLIEYDSWLVIVDAGDALLMIKVENGLTDS